MAKPHESIVKRAWRSHVVSLVVMAAYCLCIVIPFILIVYNSFRTKADFLTNTLGVPKNLNVANYINVFNQYHFHVYLLNSLYISILTLALLMFLSVTASYAIGRYQFKFRKAILFYFLLGLMFPIQLSVIPIFILIKTVGLFNTRLAAIVVIASGISMPVLLLTGFFRSLPNSFYESAKIDGASEWRIFYAIMVPLASSVILSTCIIMSVVIWNQFFIPLVFLQTDTVKTVPLKLLSFTAFIFNRSDVAFAGSVIATVPLLITFFVFSRRIIESIVSGGIKG
jgi:raffinose/stachyose/melibiose transport system permease protein